LIRIVKPAVGPPILSDPTKRGPKATADLKTAYDAGERDFSFNSDIYGAKSVKNKLKGVQRNKCCFCEARVAHVSHGDVEHFRPKGGFQQDEGDELIKPGYYWLAYDWSNLFLSCQICNQIHKKNLFPLADPTQSKGHPYLARRTLKLRTGHNANAPCTTRSSVNTGSMGRVLLTSLNAVRRPLESLYTTLLMPDDSATTSATRWASS